MVVLFGLKLPVPLVLQVAVPVLVVPFSTTLGLFTHTESSIPAFTTGASVIVMTTWSCTARQVPLPVVVTVIVTVPAAVSALLGIYVTVGETLLGVKLPVPDVVQTTPLETVNTA